MYVLATRVPRWPQYAYTFLADPIDNPCVAPRPVATPTASLGYPDVALWLPLRPPSVTPTSPPRFTDLLTSRAGPPIVHGVVTTLISTAFLATNNLGIIREYYFFMFFVLVLTASWNGEHELSTLCFLCPLQCTSTRCCCC